MLQFLFQQLLGNSVIRKAEEVAQKTTQESAFKLVKLSVDAALMREGDEISETVLKQELDTYCGKGKYTIKGNEETGWVINKDSEKYKVSIDGGIEKFTERILVANGTTRATTTRIRYISDISEKDNGEVEITKENAGNYYGLVVDYTPQSTQIEFSDGTTDPLSSIYRIFYIDCDNKYKEGENTIFLKADPPTVDHIGQYHVQEETYSEADTKIGQFNQAWNAKNGTIDSAGERKVAWMCDPTKWTGCLDTAGKAKYAIGGVSIDMLVDSFETLGLNSGFNPNLETGPRSTKEIFPYKYHNEILYNPRSTQYKLAGLYNNTRNPYPVMVYCDTLGTLGFLPRGYTAEDEPIQLSDSSGRTLSRSEYMIVENEGEAAYSPCVVLKREGILNCRELNGVIFPDSMSQEEHDSLITKWMNLVG